VAYDPGDTVPLAWEVLDGDGVLVTPASFTVTIGLPDGSTASPAASNPSTGRFELDYVPVGWGRYSVRAVGTAPAVAFSDVFDVRPAEPRYLFSLVDAKAHLNKGAARVDDDEELRGFVEAVTEILEDFLGERVIRTSVTEEVAVRDGVALLSSRPVQSLTSVVAKHGGTAWTVGDLDLSPAGVLTARTGRRLSGSVLVTVVAGPPGLSANAVLSGKRVLAHLWRTQRAGYGARGGGYGGRGGDDEESVMVGGYAVPRAILEQLGRSACVLGFA
jgi:hypothetical protein